MTQHKVVPAAGQKSFTGGLSVQSALEASDVVAADHNDPLKKPSPKSSKKTVTISATTAVIML